MDNVQLKDAALCAKKFCQNYDGKGHKEKKYEALKALSALTLRDLEKERPAYDCQYTVHQIEDEINGLQCDTADEKIRTRINGYLRNLDDILPSHIEMLNSLALENGFKSLPSYDYASGRGGGYGNKSTHRLAIESVDKRKNYNPINKFKNNKNIINYNLEYIDKQNIVLRWINNLELSGKSLNFLVIGILTESINTERNWKLTGRHIRKLRVVSYSAKCPICSSRVELENGGKEFHSRLIGRCLEAPDEHIFSFDRTNRTGYPLREYYQVMYSDNKKQN